MDNRIDAALEADYLVIGAGAMGLAFTDVLMNESDATVVIVDCSLAVHTAAVVVQVLVAGVAAAAIVVAVKATVLLRLVPFAARSGCPTSLRKK